LLIYLPDSLNFKYLKKQFLFSVIYEIDRLLYASLVKIRNQEEKKHLQNYSVISVKILDTFKQQLINTAELQGIFSIKS
jgi:hypothetical protein